MMDKDDVKALSLRELDEAVAKELGFYYSDELVCWAITDDGNNRSTLCYFSSSNAEFWYDGLPRFSRCSLLQSLLKDCIRKRGWSYGYRWVVHPFCHKSQRGHSAAVWTDSDLSVIDFYGQTEESTEEETLCRAFLWRCLPWPIEMEEGDQVLSRYR